MKLVGTIITNDLCWDKNTEYLVKRSNMRMQLLHKISAFNPPIEDLKQIYISYIRSILEQSSNVWHTSLSIENSKNIERVQKSACKLILKHDYNTYEHALQVLDLQKLSERRQYLFEKFTATNYKNNKFKDCFIENEKHLNPYLRKTNKFKIMHAKTERLNKSTIIQMQYTANKLYEEGHLK